MVKKGRLTRPLHLKKASITHHQEAHDGQHESTYKKTE
jgi:hypothetical protein